MSYWTDLLAIRPRPAWLSALIGLLIGVSLFAAGALIGGLITELAWS